MLEFSSHSKAAAIRPDKLRAIEADVLVLGLTERGVNVFKVLWLGLGPLRLPVEDDVMFLLDAYRELPAFQSGATREHGVFLGDGELEMIATRADGNAVRTRCVYAPFLNRNLATTSECEMPLDAYMQAWDALIAALADLALRSS
jgi:hypothetical protein